MPTDHAKIGRIHRKDSHRYLRPNPSRLAEMTRKITAMTCM